MKTEVKVTLSAECEVTITVEHEEGDDPTDLTKEDRQRAIAEAEGLVDCTISEVEEA